MIITLRFAQLAALVIAGAVAVVVLPLSARHKDTEEGLLARIQKEANPVRKARFEIRLGRLMLEKAAAAYSTSRLDEGQKLLSNYVERMKDSWSLLKNSGRDASRKPQGFKELDIALREDSRLLEDLRHRVPYADRGPLDQTAQEINKTHSEVLAALFPGGQSASDAAGQKPPKVPAPRQFNFLIGER